jgi:CBS domain-containing protein
MAKVAEIMTSDVACCTADTPLAQVAGMMRDRDCGEIPVCDEARRPIGVVTDRDIVCRVVAKGDDALARTAGDCMSEPVVTATPDMDVDECARLMEQYQVRRIPVVDGSGACCGMVAQADVATKATRDITAEVVGSVSQKTAAPSALSAS